MITISPTARQVLGQLIEKEKLPVGTSLRLGITTEGCEGSGTQFRYVLDFEQVPAKTTDHQFEAEGLKVVVDPESFPHLDGLQLDVRQDFGGVRFMFRNPHARHTCGCGQTFSEKEGAGSCH